MASQPRAERTRERLLRAAAVEMSEFGYSGSSLQRISSAAGVTMGALTFHFPTKSDLARAVHADGASRAGKAVHRTAETPSPDGGAPALRRVIQITLALGELLTTEAPVRAAARLTRERTPEGTDWKDSWLPSVRRLLDQACTDGELRPGVAPDTVAALTRYLVSGVEQSALPAGGTTHVDELADVWSVILSGLQSNGSVFSDSAPA